MTQDKIFATGFSFKRNANAPEFVVGKQSIKVDEAVAFLQANQKNGWVNLEVKQAKNGNFYMELDTWQPTGGNAPAGGPSNANNPFAPTTSEGGLPF
tara:strand:- start:6334 stop:6624 length:291 start_codon:yes stop_codon:yes gene_type:complete